MAANRFKQFLDSKMIKELQIQANKIVEKARDNASWSKSIPNAISMGKTEKTPNGYEIVIKVDARKDGPAPHAAAFEYGSGVHGEKGKTYIIPGVPLLAIPRKRWPNYVVEKPWQDVDPVVLASVEHPGVKAKPYLQPAIESTRAGFVTSIAKVFKRAYLDSTVRVTVISAKK